VAERYIYREVLAMIDHLDKAELWEIDRHGLLDLLHRVKGSIEWSNPPRDIPPGSLDLDWLVRPRERNLEPG
jgi:hypothetical protein